jgi:hypothetical protein
VLSAVLLIFQTEKFFRCVTGLFNDSQKRATLKLTSVNGDYSPAAIRVAQDRVATCLMINDETGTAENTEKLFRGVRGKSHAARVTRVTLRGLITSIGPSSGMGSPCLIRLAQ